VARCAKVREREYRKKENIPSIVVIGRERRLKKNPDWHGRGGKGRVNEVPRRLERGKALKGKAGEDDSCASMYRHGNEIHGIHRVREISA